MAISELGYEINTSQVLRASKDLEKLEQAEIKAEKGAVKLEGALLKAAKSAGILVGATLSIQKTFTTIASFEKSMSGVQAVTGATAEEMEELRKVAKDLGATTEFTASQAAEGLRFLGMAGFSTAESIAAIPQVLDLATAASMDLATAADITSNMMSAFGIAATDAGKVADALATAASSANTDVIQMGDGMKYVGPVAAAMGVSISDTAAAIGTLSDAGIQGSMAGTGLRRVLSSLANTTPQARKALNRMGLDIKDLNPATNDLTDIVDRLSGAGLSAADALTIFGDRGGPAILALVENNAKLQELTDKLQSVDGSASAMAGTMRDNLQGSMDGLNSAIESIIISIGESGLTAVMRAVIDTAASAARAFSGMVDAINSVTGVGSALGSAFSFLSGHIEMVGRGVVSIATFMTGRWVVAFVAARAATIRMTAATVGFSGALTVLRGALLRTGLGALVVVAGELVYKFTELVNKVGGFANVFRVAWRTGKATYDYLNEGATALGHAFNGVTLNIAAYFNDLWLKVRQGFARLMEWVQGGINKMITALNKIPQVDISPASFAEGYRAAADEVAGVSARLREDAGKSFAAAKEGFDSLVSPAQAFNSAVASIKAGMDSIDDAVNGSEVVQGGGIIDAVMGGGGEAAGGGGRGGKGKGVLDRLADDFEQLRESLMTELEITNEWFNEAELLMQAARHAGLIASEEEYLNYRERLHREYNSRLAQINGYYSDSALDRTATFMGDMAGALQSGNEKMLKIARTFGAAEALINSYVAFTDVLRDTELPWYAKIPAAMGVLAAGLNMVNAIKGVSSSGSGGGKKQAAQASAPAASAPQRTVNLTVQGEYFTGDTIQRIAEGLNDFIADGGNINVVRA